MKRLLTSVALTGLLMLTSCGNNADTMFATENVAGDYKGYSNDAPDTYNTAEGESGDNGDNGDIEQVDYKQSDVKTINRQMLVYSCDMSIDVLDFDDSVGKFHDLIDKYKGFLESENYSDGGNTSQWQYADTKKWKTLTAVIRVPSADYDNFCTDIENIGDMRRKNASVQNLTTEYSDLKTTLSIYEAKENRYLELLKEVTNEKEAVVLEEELTSIQIEIARIKTRMNNIEGDVAYSYINLTINEVREYTEEPIEERTDTFGQRLGNTLSHTWSKFLAFLEDLLFFIIRIFPYAVLIAIAAFIVSKIKKAYTKKHPDFKKARHSIITLDQPPHLTPSSETDPDAPKTEIIKKAPASENGEKKEEDKDKDKDKEETKEEEKKDK